MYQSDEITLGILCKLQRARKYLINRLCDEHLSDVEYEALEYAIVTLRTSIMCILGEIA